MKNRSELREIVMKVLYQIFILEESSIEMDIESLKKEQLEMENEFVNEIIYGVLENRSAIYELANQYLTGWPMDRLNKVDQAILCIGIYELSYTKTPSIVAINEAIELSKKYSDEKITKMINAVLDEIYHQLEEKGN
ncbi:MAG: transcription antitermination factor NusB [bacterium]|nr:transcription antitermination factor NusB [bacterium]